MNYLLWALLGYIVLKPKQVEAASSIQTINPIFTDRYDSLFRNHCSSIPVPFLRALAKNESDFNIEETDGPAWGLLQVVESVREGYNKRFKTAYTREDLLQPVVNAKIACELITRISNTLVKNHPGIMPVKNWRDPDFVSIVLFGWNAGYSEAAGVGYVLGNMTKRATIDSVLETAKRLPKASRFLKMDEKVRWCKKVTSDYFTQITRGVG